MPLGRWLRPAVAAGVTAAIGIGAYVAKSYALGDIQRLAAKYPQVAAAEGVKGILGSIPVIGNIAGFLAGPLIDKATEATMSPEDTSALARDHAILTWAPIVGIAGLVIGGVATFYFLWKDVIQSPVDAARLQELRVAGIQATGQAAGTAIPIAATGGAAAPVVLATEAHK